MSDIAIGVEGLGKRYRIGEKQEPYQTLRDSLANAALWPLRITRSIFSGKPDLSSGRDTIWALKNVGFEVKRGEVLGVIGRNGAGKSTLLKIISRITEPTEGFVEIRGRVGSLLEVGTGFHPELTGRENIYLNGAILGMQRAEISRKFDEIVAFAELSRFIDTAVKHYSSGMYMRLAFSVAAHLEPEILLVDEVLAVGDASFQKKCLGKMDEVGKQGRTVLFVSHNLGHIRRLCSRGIWLDNGTFRDAGPADKIAISFERDLVRSISSSDLMARTISDGYGSWRIRDRSDGECTVLDTEGPFVVDFHVRTTRRVSRGHIGIVLQSSEASNLGVWRLDDFGLEPGQHVVTCRFQGLPVRPGIYYWYASLWDGSRRIDETQLFPELIVATIDHSGASPEWAGPLNVPCGIKISTP